MCGRYSMALRPAQVRAYLEDENMPVHEAPEDEGDDSPRQSYNFAPGYNGIVYRADVPYWGAGPRAHKKGDGESTGDEEAQQPREEAQGETRYKIQTMKWGLIPFWTKRSPDYGSLMKTINCRDDSLIEDRGLWNTMKQKKRCVVIAQGFYEWLKKGKEKVPHFVKRKDGKLLCMLGLWDCVQYEGSEERLWTYTVITTSSNKQLNFLHDRMPVILDNGSEELRTWLDPKRSTWSKELQSLLRPYEGELEVYPVSKDVGKVGNNSPQFIVPITSSENKSNIANFFAKGATKKAENATSPKDKDVASSKDMKQEISSTPIKKEPDEKRDTIDHEGTEDNAPLPIPKPEEREQGIKHELDDAPEGDFPPKKSIKVSDSPAKSTRKTKSATSNHTASASPSKSSTAGKEKGNQRITSFFGK